MALTLQQCPVCFNHYRSTPDGKLCRHGGKVKGQECSGFRKKFDPSGARAASPLDAAPDPKPRLSTRSTAASVSGDPLDLDYSGVFEKLTAALKCVPVYDHIPKPCREKFAHDLNALLTAVCNDPGDPADWVRLHCFVPYVLQKTSRERRQVNQGNLVNKRLSEYSTIGLETLVLCFDGFNNAKSQKHNPDRWINAVSFCIEQGNLSSAVRLVCSPEGLAESSSATFDKLCSIHPKIPVDRRFFPALAPTVGCVSPAEVLRAVKSFKNDSSGGLDGLRPQHLKDVFSGPLRPDGCTLIPWRAGRCLAWDVTVPGTLAERYVNLTSKECGLAAARAADEKMKKYGNALPSMEFLAICSEVLGPMDPNTLKFLKAICKMISRLDAFGGFAPVTEETIGSLREKHPNAPSNRKECSPKEASSLTVNSQQVLHCLKSFPKGTSDGRDGLTPAHLRDVTSSKADFSELVNLIASFVNLILSGNCPPVMAPYLFGGRLVALTSPSFDNLMLQCFDQTLRDGFQSIFNVSLDPKGWLRATLPISVGGLGLGTVMDLAPSAFLASAAATVPFHNLLLPRDKIYSDNFRTQVFDGFWTVHGAEIGIETRSQKEWNAPFISSSVTKLLDLNQSNFDKARIMAVKSELESSWLKAVLNSANGTRLDDSCVRVSLGLRLSLPILTEYVCLCGANVKPLGYHGLSCRLGPGRQARHSAMNNFLVRCFQRANILTIKKPTSFMEKGSLRSDGYTIFPWAQGRSLAWDVTFPHTMAERYINLTSHEAGAAALRAADFKNSKYAALAESKIFQPVCIETFGPTDFQTQSFLNELCSRIVEVSGDPLDKSYACFNVCILNYA
ncbi:hypothetical protein HELRODRAFT_179478 [Helobdella robusta]|uniref:Uncharacterized protein n=1 Tax=Helobdella robusta TaxID=6412 RepID=T1FER8_HELRO|nr:hypothetical protein HELRODRAFT_179478 [Helobdella robusta]ESN95404.1 hypothetical protein HELRODRAFT_179478 [Helobdella robusta]